MPSLPIVPDDEITLDRHGSPAHSQPERWIVCFVPGLRPAWWHRFAHHTHKHVFALRRVDPEHWLLFEPWWSRIMVTTVTMETAAVFLRWAARGDALAVRENVPGHGSQLRAWMNCAALTTYMLGRGYRVWTPHALFQRLGSEPETFPVDAGALAGELRANKTPIAIGR